MKKVRKVLLVLAILLFVGGCNNEKCECPTDTTQTEEVYKETITDYSELYEKTTTSVVKILVTKGSYSVTGSGVVFYQEGENAYVLTNAHVVKDVNDSYEIEVIFSDSDGFESGRSEVVDARKVFKSTDEDIAVIEIPKSSKYTVAELGNSDNLNKGDFVYTIGSPFGRFNYTSAGYISSYNVPVKFNTSTVESYVIVSNAVINEGNSGGALFDKDGKLIGITTFRYDQINNVEAHEMYGSLPINHALKVARKIMVGQVYVRPSFGNLNLLSVNELGANRASYNISSIVTSGVYIASGFDTNANLSVGSIITEVNNVKVRSLGDFYVEILKYDVGANISVTLITKDGLVSNTVNITLHA